MIELVYGFRGSEPMDPGQHGQARLIDRYRIWPEVAAVWSTHSGFANSRHELSPRSSAANFAHFGDCSAGRVLGEKRGVRGSGRNPDPRTPRFSTPFSEHGRAVSNAAKSDTPDGQGPVCVIRDIGGQNLGWTTRPGTPPGVCKHELSGDIRE